jgi:serine/threonine-protein kinase HipA
MNNTLSVYLHERRAGTLSDVGNAQLQFNYDEVYLQSDGLCLSKSLPLTAEPFADHLARPFFSGILPDDQQLEGLAQHLKVSRRNVFKLLREVGGECAGAVSLYDDNAGSAITDESSKYALSDSALFDLLNTAKSRPILGGDDNVRLSLAGAQSKFALVIKENQTYLSAPNSPSTHIIKPASKSIKGLVENEYFCMQLASSVGIDVPQVSLRTVLAETAYQIKRYDRVEQNGEVKRLHQEDFCQALGVVPENKYEFEGGPSLKECIDTEMH